MECLLIHVPEFSKLTGTPIRTIYNLISTKRDPLFPRPRYKGKHPVWLRSQVLDYVNNLPTEPLPRKKRRS